MDDRNNPWRGYPDYWDDFEFREIVEIIWNTWRDKVDELKALLIQLDDSKSIFTVPYQLDKTWLKLVWDPDSLLSRPVEGEQLLDIPQLVDSNYKSIGIPFRVNREANAVELMPQTPSDLEPLKGPGGGIELWAPVYYIHNPVIRTFYAPLLGLGNIEERFDRVYSIKPYSAMFYRIVKGLWYVFVKGPTIENIAQGISIIYNIPVALRAGTITRIETTGQTTILELKPDDGVRPDVDRWIFSSNFYCPFEVGDHVEAGTTLVLGGAEVLDYLNAPNWWETYASENERKKIEIIEKYCTTLVKLNAENYFRELIIEGAQDGTGLLQEYINHVLPSYVNMLLFLFHVWVDETHPPEDELSFRGTIKWYETPYRYEDGTPVEAACVRPLLAEEEGVNTYAKHDGVIPYHTRGLFYEHFPLRVVRHDKGRLFIPRDSVVVDVRLSDGTSVTVLHRGLHWIDVNPQEITSDVIVTFRRIDYDAAGGLEAWQKEVYVQEWAYAHNYDSKTRFFSMLGEGVSHILYIKVPAEMLGEPIITLQEGVDYTIHYNRTQIGTGTIDITFLSGEYREIYLGLQMLPCVPEAVDSSRNPIPHAASEFIQDTLTIKVRIADPDKVEYRDGKFYFEDDEVFIGPDDLPRYNGEYAFDGEIDFGASFDFHFYREIVVA